jgi:hypothetical protein
MTKAPASRNRESVRFAQRETRVNRCMAIRSFRRVSSRQLNGGASRARFEASERAWQMRRDAPEILWGSYLWRYMAGLLCDRGDVSLGRGKYACAAGERNM